MEDTRRLLASGLDPMTERKAAKDEKAAKTSNSFKAVALEYFDVRGREWSEDYRKRLENSMERDIFPWLGDRPVQEITAPELLKVLKRIAERAAGA